MSYKVSTKEILEKLKEKGVSELCPHCKKEKLKLGKHPSVMNFTRAIWYFMIHLICPNCGYMGSHFLDGVMDGYSMPILKEEDKDFYFPD